MANILFGVCGVGYGHVIRSRVLLEYLTKKHNVFIISSFTAYPFLKNKFRNVHKVDGLEFAFKNNKVMTLNTIFKNVKKVSRKNYDYLKKLKIKINQFNPGVVISDWELFSIYYAKDKKIKLLGFDNEHYLLDGDFKIPKGHTLDYLKALIVSKSYRTEDTICVLLPGQKLKPDSKSKPVMPIIRNEIINKKVSKKNFILVYRSIPKFDVLINILVDIDEEFVIYGYDENKKVKNLTYKKFNESNFIKDLLNCRAVICSAGMTLISEAIYLNKPMFVVPIKGQFEQFLNAYYVKSNNLGEYSEDFDVDLVKNFLKQKYKTLNFKPGNKDLFKIVDKFIKNDN